MELGVRDRTYVVFGGTRGIGFAAARALADDGARLALVGRDTDRAAEAARTLSESGGRAIGLASDVTVDGEAERVSTWTSRAGHTVEVSATIDTPTEDIETVEVRSTDGGDVLLAASLD